MDRLDRDDYPLRHTQEEISRFRRNGVCKFCGNEVSLESKDFYCHTCLSHYHKDCLTVSYPKIHEHTLTFIHRNNAFICDACGSVDNEKVNMFACLQCDFYVHRTCIFLPKVIKITRHSHFLAHTLCIPDGNSECNICWGDYLTLKIGYGGYICTEKECDFVAHSFCATMDEVWDGRDFEGEPKEDCNSEVDPAPLVEIDGGFIRHFSHDHDLMRLDTDFEEESGKVCHACILPIDFGKFFSCKQCDFALHSACGSLPRKMENALHRHPLILRTNLININEGFFTCYTCHRKSCGFMYQCSQDDCGFKIDVKCASFVENSNHVAHPEHPLFLLQTAGDQWKFCEGCGLASTTVARCNTCLFSMELKCLTLPILVKYKHDVHPLTLCSDNCYSRRFGPPSYTYCGCEICEEQINVNYFFYICRDCNTTLHIGCMLGKYPYLKPNHRINVDGLSLEIISNNSFSRSSCQTCHRICQDKLIFTTGKDICFCSINCIHSFNKRVGNRT